MKFQFYYEKLIDSEEYKKFMKENPLAFPCSGFFALDVEGKGKDNVASIDLFLEKPKKKMFSFKISGKNELLPVENFDSRIPEKLSMNYTFDLVEIKEKMELKMQEQKINGKIQRILFSLQKLKGVDYLLATVFLTNLGLIKSTIELSKNKIVDFEKKSFFDMIKIVKK